jgi:transposase
MKEKVRFLGLDVHAETIAVAVAEQDGEVRNLGTIANREESIRKLVKKLGPVEQLRACYEAGPTGYVLYWQLTQLGVECVVVAPTLVPVKAGDRVKTDRRDAEKLARNHRSDDLTAVWVPDEGSEALRDLVRAREAAKQDQLRARHRLSKFLLRAGRRPAMRLKAWTELPGMGSANPLFAVGAGGHAAGLSARSPAHGRADPATGTGDYGGGEVGFAAGAGSDPGLTGIARVAHLSAVTIAAELGNISRFESARKLMGYSGAVPSEDSSGKRQRRGNITKTGNEHLRRIAVESAWSYRFRPAIGPRLRQRQAGVPEDQRDRLEGADPAAEALQEADGGRQGQAEDHHRGGARTAGLRLGHRDQSGNGRQAADGGMTKSNSTKARAKTFPRRKKPRRSKE